MFSGSRNTAANSYLTGAQRAMAVAVVLAACVLGLQQGASAMPPVYSFGFPGKAKSPAEGVLSFAEDNECYHDGEVETLCQRCAKLTKSPVVYPMCCEDKEDAREWCDLYLNYGIKSTDT